ncbi:MAG: lipoyl(octanoyl) transferase LipB [Proteobacteria bacterium]|nr:lipoyl(octanoyl) transferase LipB [Pseudomonadota bacterium]MDA1136484.1 lipoyl(octanoyl) transferase LipB [Pseudomonadota bacterium]
MKNKIEWTVSEKLIHYDYAMSIMQDRVSNIKSNFEKELVWLLEHESVYTAGTSAKEKDFLNNNNLLVKYTGRGGQWTWHGPGQRVVYVMLNLKQRLADVKAYVNALEEWIILSLKDLSINGFRLENKPGVWIKSKDKGYNKIAALGVRISSWVTWHGISINVNPDLEFYKNIVPCGISDAGITSIQNLKVKITMDELDKSLYKNFFIVFGDNGIFKIK